MSIQRTFNDECETTSREWQSRLIDCLFWPTCYIKRSRYISFEECKRLSQTRCHDVTDTELRQSLVRHEREASYTKNVKYNYITLNDWLKSYLYLFFIWITFCMHRESSRQSYPMDEYIHPKALLDLFDLDTRITYFWDHDFIHQTIYHKYYYHVY